MLDNNAKIDEYFKKEIKYLNSNLLSLITKIERI